MKKDSFLTIVKQSPTFVRAFSALTTTLLTYIRITFVKQVTFNAMGFLGINSRRANTAQGISATVNKLQMKRVNARWVATEMIDLSVLLSAWQWVNSPSVSHSMYRFIFTVIPNSRVAITWANRKIPARSSVVLDKRADVQLREDMAEFAYRETFYSKIFDSHGVNLLLGLQTDKARLGVHALSRAASILT